LALLSEDVVWHVPGRSAIAGEHRGRPAVLRYFELRREKTRATFEVIVRRVVADDEFAFQLAGGRARIRDETLDWETVGVFRVAEGKIAECWLLPFDQYLFDEIWA
jgi:ketosteroid isomerase-like protein